MVVINKWNVLIGISILLFMLYQFSIFYPCTEDETVSLESSNKVHNGIDIDSHIHIYYYL